MNVRKINGVWMPEREQHMVSFLTDANTTVDGVGTYQLKKIERVLAEMRDRMMPFRNALDVGSHVGTWTRFLAEHFVTVHCFEPHPVHRECWHRNMDEWSIVNAELHPYALGEHEAKVRLMSNPVSSGDTWLDDGHAHDGYEVVGEVAVRTIDGFEVGEVDLIKVDCEGGELAVLRGAARTLREFKPFVCVEQKPGRAEKYGLPRTAACGYLESLGARRVAEISGDYLYSWS